MKSFLLATICFVFTGFVNAQGTIPHNGSAEKSLALGLGFGAYQQGTLKGNNIVFSADYKISKRYTIGQMSQFAFLSTHIMGQRVSYVNQHISVVGMKNFLDNRYATIMAGAGLGYTNYHQVRVRKTPAVPEKDFTPENAYMVTTQSQTQVTFPILFDATFKLSKTVALGARAGTYIVSGNGFFNYSFVNPVIKVSL